MPLKKKTKTRHSRSKKKYRRKSRKRGGSAQSIKGRPESTRFGLTFYVSGKDKGGYTTCNNDTPCTWGVCEKTKCVYLEDGNQCLPFKNNSGNELRTRYGFNVTSIEDKTYGYPNDLTIREAADKKCLPGSYCGGVDRNYGFTCIKVSQ